MERGSKRKAAALSSTPDARPSKRQKTPDTNATAGPENVKKTGLKFIEQLKSATDKNGTLIATAFLTLPDKEEYADYYVQIKLPIAIDTLEKKLNKRQYENLSQVESDIKRMVANAKEYNLPKSEVHNDAERVRKIAFNFMKQHNPAYRNRNYTAIATPLPEEMPAEKPTEKPTKLRLTAPSKQTPAPDTKKPSRDTDTPMAEPSRPASAKAKDEPAETDGAPLDNPYKGLTFQQSQEKIIKDLIKYTEPDSDLQIFLPFVQLPSRLMTEYYQVIKSPMSLKGIEKKIFGWHSRTEQTGITDMKSWDAFENEVARIWHNAREFNEDGSDMYLLAGELEDAFKTRLAEAKKVVEEPEKPRIKLNVGGSKQPPSTGIKLNLGSQKPSPAPSSNTTSQPKPASPTKMSPTDAVAPKAPPNKLGNATRATASPALPAKTPNGIPTPAIAAPASNQVNGTMLPPTSTMRPPSSSNNHPPLPPQPGTFPQPQYNPPVYSQPTNTFDCKWRPKAPTKSDGTPGDPDILMSKLHVATHPDIPIWKPFKLAIPANRTMSQQSVTATLGSQHAVLRLTADLADQLKGPNARPYRLFVTNNGMRQSQRVVHDYAHMPNGLVNGAGAPQAEKDKRPSWDVRMVPGTNRVEIEVVAAAKAGAGNSDLVMEKISLFVFLMKT